MRRDLNWKTRREDGTRYEVRVVYFGKKFKFQFKEQGAERWDYDRKPDRADMEEFLSTLERYYQRSRATLHELEEGRRMMAEFERRAKA
ncbi:MAG: hypothetical protein PW734_02770 [Verrucomicrobium sp.]|nr:hypothetical protein [Verrucomicrobium sp.]